MTEQEMQEKENEELNKMLLETLTIFSKNIFTAPEEERNKKLEYSFNVLAKVMGTLLFNFIVNDKHSEVLQLFNTQVSHELKEIEYRFNNDNNPRCYVDLESVRH